MSERRGICYPVSAYRIRRASMRRDARPVTRESSENGRSDESRARRGARDREASSRERESVPESNVTLQPYDPTYSYRTPHAPQNETPTYREPSRVYPVLDGPGLSLGCDRDLHSLGLAGPQPRASRTPNRKALEHAAPARATPGERTIYQFRKVFRRRTPLPRPSAPR